MTPSGKVWCLLLVTLAFVLPLVSPSYAIYVYCMIGIYYIVGLSMNLLVATAGQISIGHAAFWALGAYGSAVLVTRFGVPFELAVIGGGLLSAVFGLLVAIPAMRIQGHYLAIATLAFSMVIQRMLHEWESVTGGRTGMFVPRPSLLGQELSSDRAYFYVIAAVGVLFTWFIYNIQRRASGRALMALRMSPVAARCCGINRSSSLITVFVLSAFMTGISGAMYGSLVGYLSISSFTLVTSLSFLTMIVIGGAGRLSGALVGAAFLALTPEFMRTLGDAQMIVYGVLLIAVMLVLPGGLVSLFARLTAIVSARRRDLNVPTVPVSGKS